MTTISLRLAIVAGIFAAGVSAASADVVTLGAAKDTMIFQNNVNNGAGGGPGFLAGTNAQPSIRRGMIEFDLNSIPKNATITGVELRLRIGQIAGSGGGSGSGGFSHPTIGLHEMLVDWGEANTGASTATGLGGTGQGNPAQAGDATWNARFFGTTSPWGTPGGQANVDYVGTPSASAVQSDNLNDFSFWSSAEMVADVQGWLNGSATNFGWILINFNENVTSDPLDIQTFRGFYSRNYNPNPAPADLVDYLPRLTVTYAVPEPGTIVLFAVGAVAMGCVSARRGLARTATIAAA